MDCFHLPVCPLQDKFGDANPLSVLFNVFPYEDPADKMIDTAELWFIAHIKFKDAQFTKQFHKQ